MPGRCFPKTQGVEATPDTSCHVLSNSAFVCWTSLETAVSLGRHPEDFRGSSRMQRIEPRLDVTRLPHRQRAFAGGDDNLGGMIHGGKKTSGFWD